MDDERAGGGVRRTLWHLGATSGSCARPRRDDDPTSTLPAVARCLDVTANRAGRRIVERRQLILITAEIRRVELQCKVIVTSLEQTQASCAGPAGN
uniref:Uncharacterized protein n=1 Tax=Peronospora matthiolae TaxID=2874970 RepID=A0AAV1TJX0_9STRA